MFFVHCLQMRIRLIGILAVNSKMRLTVSVELACTICACNSPLESVRAAVWGHAHPSSVDNTHAGGTEQQAQHGINKLDPFRGKIAPSRSSNISSSGGTARNVLACAHTLTHIHRIRIHIHTQPRAQPRAQPREWQAAATAATALITPVSFHAFQSVPPYCTAITRTVRTHRRMQVFARNCTVLHINICVCSHRSRCTRPMQSTQWLTKLQQGSKRTLRMQSREEHAVFIGLTGFSLQL